DGQLLLWVVYMTWEQVQTARGYEGISSISPSYNFGVAGVLDQHHNRLASSQEETASERVGRRGKDAVAAQYSTQSAAPTELVSLSQPSGDPDITLFNNYVSDARQGNNTFIYHIEHGVDFLGLSQVPHLPTYLSNLTSLKPGIDYTTPTFHSTLPPYHGTCTASKALGRTLGVAKSATLISDIMASFAGEEMASAFAEVALDLLRRPERRGRSVVSLSLGADGREWFGGVFDGVGEGDLVKGLMAEVMAMDVPVVVAAGNHGAEARRGEVDMVPAVWAGDDEGFPLIAAGSCDGSGERSVFSQGGGKVTVHAVGEDVTCYTGEGLQVEGKRRGTSYAAPIVAGQIAVWLSSENVPVDTTRGRLVGSMRNYLKSSPAAAWARVGNTRVIWNGVTEANNPR
ncbi:peptidase S8/S53 domain-containing protein, partial [Coniochaeta sp. 2T2.1]